MACVIIFSLLASPSEAQDYRLPPPGGSIREYAGEDAGYRYPWPAERQSQITSEILRLPALASEPEDESGLLPASLTRPRDISEPLLNVNPELGGPPQLSSHKNSLLQRISFTTTWLDRNDFGQTDFETYVVFGFPLPTPESPLLITPGFALRLLDGPAAPDVPSKLFDAYLEFRWLRMLTPSWGMDLAVSPGVYSDFNSVHSGAIRITGRALFRYDWSERLKIIFGVVYLDRSDFSILPAVGLIWTPFDGLKFDLIFPRPRASWRINWNGYSEDWLYIGAEFGGGTYGVEDSTGAEDQLTISDYRLLIGLERKYDGGTGFRLELGYVFGREIQFDGSTPDFSPSDTVMIRAGVQY